MRVVEFRLRLSEFAVKMANGAVDRANVAISYRMRHAISLLRTVANRDDRVQAAIEWRKVLFRVSSVRGDEVKLALWAPDACATRSAD